ncbi:LysR family transcriptional regulator [Paenibacillus sp.]|jgi:DNA-binding transcriptional LysR family regulator|uniref:LysR family transcriptional regulator n=1 Tax=Paenibacillus sp. TaxID=58172 RepID=UPI002820CC86|nr:LysR family transcriptional regulator [Paenibacillus sp.]MDR0271499.1 LysR family transcriptional regulator [Paenibacillus sp.]
MNIERLEYLVEAAKTGSMSKAAQNLHVTISAISQSISSIEEEWGVTLLKRSRAGAVPTVEGEAIIKKAVELLQKYDELKKVAQGHSDTIEGRLRVATIPGPMFLLEKAVLDFKKQHSQVKVEIAEQGSQDIIDDVLNDKCDLGIIILFKNRLVKHLGLNFERLLKVRMVAATSLHSPLAFQKTITPEELIKQPVVLYNDDYVKWFMDEFQKKYGNVDILYTTNNRALISRACVNYLAVTLGLNYSFITEPLFAEDDTIILDLDLPQQSPVYLGVIHRKDRSPSVISRHFLERLKHDISDLQLMM